MERIWLLRNGGFPPKCTTSYPLNIFQVLFDLDTHESRTVNKDLGKADGVQNPLLPECFVLLGVYVKIVDKHTGITWREYQDALKKSSQGSGNKELAPCTMDFLLFDWNFW